MNRLKSRKLWILVVPAILLFFQNCTPMKFVVSPEGLETMASQSEGVFQTDEDVAADFNLKKVLSVATRFALVAAPGPNGQGRSLHGKIENFDPQTGTFRYVPDADYNGRDVLAISYLYEGSEKQDQILITVRPVNDAPTATDMTMNVPLNEVFEFNVNAMTAVDRDGDPLQLAILDRSGQETTALSGSWGSLRLIREENSMQVFEYQALTLEDQLLRFRVTDPAGLQAEFQVTFSVGSLLKDLKPALAVRVSSCLFCHSSIKGNVITDFGGSGDAFLGGQNETVAGDYIFGNYSLYGARSFASTLFVEGTVFVPRIALSAQGKSVYQSVLAEGKGPMKQLPAFGLDGEGRPLYTVPAGNIFTAHNTANVQTVADYLNISLNYRTPEYISLLKNYTMGLQKNPDVQPLAEIREVKSVRISAPTAELIRSKIQAGQPYTFYRQGGSDVQLKGLVQNPRGYFTNSSTEEFECNGDLFIDGPLFLNSLKINTLKGCRIYSTGTVFIQAPEGTAQNRPGIQFRGGDESNLQITSSKAIMMGLGSCTTLPPKDANGLSVFTTPEQGSLGRRMFEDNRKVLHKISASLAEYNLIRDASGKLLLKDAGNCVNPLPTTNRSVDFERLLLNAPRIDSRYTGNFKGSVISEFPIWSLGSFHYSYDPVFDQVPILPLIPTSTFLSVVDCVNDGVDGARKLDNRYRTCLPN